MRKSVCAFSISEELDELLSRRARELGVSKSSVVERAVTRALGLPISDIAELERELNGRLGCFSFRAASDKLLVARKKLSCEFSPTLKVSVRQKRSGEPLTVKFSVCSINERLIALLGDFFCEHAENESREAESVSFSDGVFEVEFSSLNGAVADGERAAEIISRFYFALEKRLESAGL